MKHISKSLLGSSAAGAAVLFSSLLVTARAAAQEPAAAPAPGASEPAAAPEPTPEPTPEPAPPTGAASSAPPEESEPAPGPKMNLFVAPPDKPLVRRAYAHEGFYLRVNVGPGWMYSAINSTDSTSPDIEGHAFALGADVLIGGSPSPGMAIGGGVLTNLGFGADFQEDGVSQGSGTVFQFIAGPFFDAFPNDKEGFHLGTVLGFAGMTQSSGIAGVTDSAFGGGGGAFLGYGAWVAPEWSAGFDLRATGGYMVGGDYGAGIFSVVALVTILNH